MNDAVASRSLPVPENMLIHCLWSNTLLLPIAFQGCRIRYSRVSVARDSSIVISSSGCNCWYFTTSASLWTLQNGSRWSRSASVGAVAAMSFLCQFCSATHTPGSVKSRWWRRIYLLYQKISKSQSINDIKNRGHNKKRRSTTSFFCTVQKLFYFCDFVGHTSLRGSDYCVVPYFSAK